MPPTREQFAALRKRGLNPDQIADLWRRAEQGAPAQPERSEVIAAAGAPHLARITGPMREFLPAAAASLANLIPGAGIPAALARIGAGAALGTAGEAGRLRLRGELPAEPGAAVRASLPGGALQGGFQGLSEGMAAFGPTMARSLMERALKISSLTSGKPVTPRALRGFAETALEHRLPVGGRKMLGSERAIEKAKVSGTELSKTLEKARRAGVRLRASDLTKEVDKLLDDITYQPLAMEDKQSVKRMVESFLRDHPGPLTPAAAKRMKREAQAIALPLIRRAGQARPGVNAADAIRGRFNYAIARGTRKALENLPQGYGKQIAARESETSRLLRLEPALRRAEAATSKVTFSPFGPLRPLGAGTPMLRFSRPTVSRAALALEHPLARMAATHGPRSLAALLQAFSQPDVLER